MLYFPGCGASLFYRSIGVAAVRLLLDAGVSVVLPPNHLCCGYPLLASGCKDQFDRIGAENQKILEATIRQAEAAGFAIKAVLTSCGTCREGIKGYSFEIPGHAPDRIPRRGPVCHPKREERSWPGPGAASLPRRLSP